MAAKTAYKEQRGVLRDYESKSKDLLKTETDTVSSEAHCRDEIADKRRVERDREALFSALELVRSTICKMQTQFQRTKVQVILWPYGCFSPPTTVSQFARDYGTQL